MHGKFILREDFWLKEAKRKLSPIISEPDIDFAFLGLEDGHYVEVADMLYKRMLK